jgi:hypothetical protein
MSTTYRQGPSFYISGDVLKYALATNDEVVIDAWLRQRPR